MDVVNSTAEYTRKATPYARIKHDVLILLYTTSSLVPIELITKLEWTQSNAQRNVEQLQNPRKGVTFKNDLTTTEQTHM